MSCRTAPKSKSSTIKLIKIAAASDPAKLLSKDESEGAALVGVYHTPSHENRSD